MRQTVTIAVFSKHEDRTLGSVLDGILKHRPPEEVLLVLYEVTEQARRLAAERGVALFKDNGRGKGAAIRQVIDRAPGDILVFIDADGSHEPADIPLLLEPLREGRAELVIASRYRGGSDEFAGDLDSWLHRAGNYLSAFFIGLLWGSLKGGLIDCQNGFRAIDVRTARTLDLRSDGFAIEQEMVMQCLKRGCRVAEVPSREYRRRHGKSHIRYTSAVPEYLGSILRNLVTGARPRCPGD